MSEFQPTPAGIEPFSISLGNMGKLGLKSGDDITDVYEFKVYEKSFVVEDCNKNGFMSAFHALRKKIEAFPGDKILIVADLECSYKEMCNFYWCATEATTKEHLERFEKEGVGAGGDSKEGGKKEDSFKDMLVKYIAILRIDTEKKLDTLCHVSTDGKQDEHKAIVEEIVNKNKANAAIFGTRPFRVTDNEGIDYMAHGVKMDDDLYPMESTLVIAAAFGKLFSSLAEPELSESIEKAFKVQASITADECEKAIYHEFDERVKEIFEKVAEAFEDEADDPSERPPEYEENPLVARREWTPITMEEVKLLDKNAPPDTLPKRRATWAFTMPTVEELKATNSRRLKKFFMSKPRRDFGWEALFEDAEEETVPHFPRMENENFGAFVRQDLDFGFQCGAPTMEAETQTTWARKINQAEQVEAQTFTPSELKEIKESGSVAKFLESKLPIVKHFLESNYVVDLFHDEFDCLKEVETSIGKNAESNLKSMNQLRVPGMPARRICDISWHPTVKGMIAFACGCNLDIDKRLELSGKVMWTSIIMWSLSNLLAPRLRLAVPGDVVCFKINKDNPYLIVAGLRTGQVIMWDLSDKNINGEDVYANMKAAEDTGGSSVDSKTSTPSFSCKATSVLQVSHSRSVSDLQWLPKGVTITRKGKYQMNPEAKAPQFFATVSADGFMYFWDVKLKETHNADGTVDKNLRWGPTYKLAIAQDGAKMNLSGKKFTFLTGDDNQTRMVVVTQAGQVAFGNFAMLPTDDGKVEAVERFSKSHSLSCVAVEQSPHFPDIVLTVGDWSFSLWKKGCTEPLFTSACAPAYLTVGCWSPTRPGLLVLGRSDGILDIWVLIDQIHKPVLHRTVRANTEVSSISFWHGHSKQQLLAVGDFTGTLHIFSVPRILMRPANHEEREMRNWYDHEVERLKYVEKREASRPEVKTEKKEAKKKDEKAPTKEQILDGKESAYQELLKVFKEQLCPDEEKEERK